MNEVGSRRATDAEREAVRAMLSDARVVGMITEDEWSIRVDKTVAAKTVDDLHEIYGDITGTTLPVLNISVSKDWMVDAGKVLSACDNVLQRHKIAFRMWITFPIAVYILIASFGTIMSGFDYGFTGGQIITLVLLVGYVIFVYVMVILYMMSWREASDLMKELLNDAGVGK